MAPRQAVGMDQDDNGVLRVNKSDEDFIAFIVITIYQVIEKSPTISL